MKSNRYSKVTKLSLGLSIALILGACHQTELPNDVLPYTELGQYNSVGLLSKPVLLTESFSYETSVDISGSTQKRLVIDVNLKSDYANLNVSANGLTLANNLAVPRAGTHTINTLVKFNGEGKTHLKFERLTADLEMLQIRLQEVNPIELPQFTNISKQTDFNTEHTYKYGGPSIADIDRDGDYDFILNNHNHVPTQLVTNNGADVEIERLFDFALDFHGSAVGDYDADGDLDIIVAKGGGNGTNPTSYALLKNVNGKFTAASNEAGITTPARGRSPRWIDLDLDGDLDLALFNAKTPNYDGPTHVFYQNDGKGAFSQQRINDIEFAQGERVLVTDFNRDGIDDLVVYSPISLWKGNGDFTFTNVTNQYIPQSVAKNRNYNAAVDLDVNNDGLTDLYFAAGKTHYKLSKKSIDYNPAKKQLAIRDDGEKGTTAIDFVAKNDILLHDMELTFRQYKGGFAIFLGENKTRKIVKAKGFQPLQLPKEMRAAPDKLAISPIQAQGWPGERNENGLYIGHLEGNNWRAEWVRDGNIYWTTTFAIDGIDSVNYEWTPNNRNEQDTLLINTGDKFADASDKWNLPLGNNSWGATRADFNNDGWQDIMINRYGYLKQRIADLVLLNTGKNSFETYSSHGAFDANDPGHGDMGQAFDFNLDGKVDVLAGSEEEGPWYLYQNTQTYTGHYLLFEIGYSPSSKIDPMSAEIIVTTESGEKYYQRVGSAGEIFSQSLMNIVHFGLGKTQKIKSVVVTWRNGETAEFSNLVVDKKYNTDELL